MIVQVRIVNFTKNSFCSTHLFDKPLRLLGSNHLLGREDIVLMYHQILELAKNRFLVNSKNSLMFEAFRQLVTDVAVMFLVHNLFVINS